MITDQTTRLNSATLGKYRIAANPRQLPSGRFSAHLSIASGRGSASTARVMRFVDEFSTRAAAADFAMAQGLDWVRGTSGVLLPDTDHPICLNQTAIETRN